MLSSLACELIFNDARDSGRRHSKMEKTCPHNIHAVAHKSTTKRPSGGQPLVLSNADWSLPLPSKNVRNRVHSALKATDVELGVNSDKLTRNKASIYTKPHIMSQRLSLLKVLTSEYTRNIKDELQRQEDRMEVLDVMFKESWVSKLVPKHYFITWDVDNPGSARHMVLSAGPHFLKVLDLEAFSADMFTPNADKIRVRDTWTGSLLDCAVTPTEPCLAFDQLAWRATGPFTSLTEVLAESRLLETPRSLLASVCSALGLKHSKLTYKARVRMFLEHMKKSTSFIESVLEEIPDAEPKPAKVSRLCASAILSCFLRLM